MKPKSASQFVQGVLLMLAMLCGGLLLFPGGDAFNKPACISMESPLSGQDEPWMPGNPSMSCSE
jgi:hypothetical protein